MIMILPKNWLIVLVSRLICKILDNPKTHLQVCKKWQIHFWHDWIWRIFQKIHLYYIKTSDWSYAHVCKDPTVWLDEARPPLKALLYIFFWKWTCHLQVLKNSQIIKFCSIIVVILLIFLKQKVSFANSHQ